MNKQTVYLKTKTSKDSIRVNNDLLLTVSNNRYILGPNDSKKVITNKQHDFMTFIFKGLQIMMNDLDNRDINGIQFADLSFDDKITYMESNIPFFEINSDDIIPFLEMTSSGKVHHISKMDALTLVSDINVMANTLSLYTDKEYNDRGEMSKILLFPTSSLKYESLNGSLINITSFSLKINSDAIPYILALFDKSQSFGTAYIEHLLRLKNVHNKNLYYFMSRYESLISRENGFDIKLSTITDHLGISKSKRPYSDLIQIVKSFNKDLSKMGNTYDLVITPIKKDKHGKITKINLKMIDTESDTNTLTLKNSKPLLNDERDMEF